MILHQMQTLTSTCLIQAAMLKSSSCQWQRKNLIIQQLARAVEREMMVIPAFVWAAPMNMHATPKSAWHLMLHWSLRRLPLHLDFFELMHQLMKWQVTLMYWNVDDDLNPLEEQWFKCWGSFSRSPILIWAYSYWSRGTINWKYMKQNIRKT